MIQLKESPPSITNGVNQVASYGRTCLASVELCFFYCGCRDYTNACGRLQESEQNGYYMT